MIIWFKVWGFCQVFRLLCDQLRSTGSKCLLKNDLKISSCQPYVYYINSLNTGSNPGPGATFFTSRQGHFWHFQAILRGVFEMAKLRKLDSLGDRLPCKMLWSKKFLPFKYVSYLMWGYNFCFNKILTWPTVWPKDEAKVWNLINSIFSPWGTLEISFINTKVGPSLRLYTILSSGYPKINGWAVRAILPKVVKHTVRK